ncbi:MAG: hypothetical protein AB8G05_00455 [Oligoflexales bacterium]
MANHANAGYIRGEVFNDIFDGLDHLHRNNLSHWDLKPGNLLRGQDDKVKIIDLDDVSPPTNEVEVFSLDYAPPERFRRYGGEKINVDGQASDIYAAGVMLFKSLYGKKKSNHDLVMADLLDACCNIKVKELSVTPPARPDGISGDTLKYVDMKDVREAILKYSAQLEGTKKAELELIADMIRSNPKKRIKIEDARLRWQELYPRSLKAENEAIKVFKDLDEEAQRRALVNSNPALNEGFLAALGGESFRKVAESFDSSIGTFDPTALNNPMKGKKPAPVKYFDD